MQALLAFVGVSVLVIVTPGQDTALTVRNTLAAGRRSGVFTAVGVVTGQLIWALATSAGVAAVLLASESVFVGLRIVGSAYLAYLGIRALLAARRRTAIAAAEPSAEPSTARSAVASYRQGLLSNLGNPKIAVFFTSLLPQFAGRDASFFALVGFGTLFAVMTFVWLSVYAVVVARAGAFLRRPDTRRALDTVTGLVLLALGLRLATERR